MTASKPQAQTHRWQRWLTGSLATAFVIVVLVAVIRFRGAESPRETPAADAPAPAKAALKKPAPPSQGFVGSAACAECHAEIADEYQSHPMAHSSLPVAAASAVEDYEDAVEFSPTPQRRYRVERRGDEVFHHEIGLDRQGQVIFDQAVPVQYTIGSGQRGRSYLINRGGWLYMSPISWYSQSRRWDLSPEYDPQDHYRFERPAVERCLYCHTGRLAFPEGRTGTFVRHGEEPFLESVIGCERCHGPGQAHIELRQSQQPVEHDPIVNPTKLPPLRREAVCIQCHLVGEYEILRYGKTFADFRPGDHIGDVWPACIRADSGDGPATVSVSQVSQMLHSKCFRASQGELGCISCHSPHAIPKQADNRQFYQDRSLRCHEQQGCSLPLAEQQQAPAQGSCVACHMPRFGTSDIPHTTQTDHRILRRPQPEKKPREQNSDQLVLQIFDADWTELSDRERERAQGLVLALRAQLANDPIQAKAAVQLLRPIAEASPDDIDVLNNLGDSYLLQGDVAAAVQNWRTVLEADPRNREALRYLATTFQQMGQYQESLDYFEQYVAIEPWKAETHGRLSHVEEQLGLAEPALESAYRAYYLDPSASGTCRWLGELHRRRGEAEQAREFAELFNRLEAPRTSQDPTVPR